MSNVTAIFSNNSKFVEEKRLARLLYDCNFWGDHRGQAGAGATMVDNWGDIKTIRGLGVARVSTPLERMLSISNRSTFAGIGHTCYAKMKAPKEEDTHPLRIETGRYEIYLSSDGIVLGKNELRERLEDEGCKFTSNTNGEVIGMLFAKHLGDGEDYGGAAAKLLDEIDGRGGFSIAMLVRDKRKGKSKVVAIRDRKAIKPLCYGELDGTFFINSETYPLEHFGIDIKNVKRVNGGEMLVIDENGLELYDLGKGIEKPCIFEIIYYGGSEARVLEPLGPLFPELARRCGVNPEDIPTNYTVRGCFGIALTDFYKTPDVDVLIGVPASGIPVTVGLSKGYGIYRDEGMVKTEIERTFQWTDPYGRVIRVGLKLKAIIDILRGKKVGTGDDSVVYGGISGVKESEVGLGFEDSKIGLVGLLKYVAEVQKVVSHISYSVMPFQCFFEFDKPEKRMAAEGLYGLSTEEQNAEMEKRLEPEWKRDKRLTMRFQPLRNIYAVCGNGFCTACADGNYPVRDEYIPPRITRFVEARKPHK